MSRNKKKHALRAGVFVSVGGIVISSARGTYVYDPNDFATQVVSNSATLTGSTVTNSPAAMLGRPTLKFNNSGNPSTPDFRRTKLIEGSFNTGLSGEKIVTTLNVNQQVTVKMGRHVEDDPNDPFGVDFIVFGNSFYVGTGDFISDSTNLNTFTLSGTIFTEKMKVSVSQDNVNWYTYDSGPYADTVYPTNSYLWDRATASWTNTEADPTLPVNPSLSSNIHNISAADALDIYAGSAGGIGFDLAPSGLSWIQYVRVQGTTGFAGGEVDAIADVHPLVELPEPSVIGLIGVGALGLLRRRRR